MEKQQEGLGKLIENMDQDQLRHTYGSNKSIQEEAAEADE